MIFSKGINASTVAFVMIAVMIIQFLIPYLAKGSTSDVKVKVFKEKIVEK